MVLIGRAPLGLEVLQALIISLKRGRAASDLIPHIFAAPLHRFHLSRDYVWNLLSGRLSELGFRLQETLFDPSGPLEFSTLVTFD